MLFYILFIIGGIVVDQLTKYLAVTFLSPVTTVPVIPHVFHLTYVENTGAAFSIFAGKQIFLILLTLIFIVVLSTSLSSCQRPSGILMSIWPCP